MSPKSHWITWPALAVLLLDQGTKALVLRKLPLHESVPVVSGFFNLVHVRNRGMAFGLLNRPDNDLGSLLLVGATLVALAILLFWFRRLRPDETMTIVPLSLVLGGAVGNLVDRLYHREVIDFLDFHLGRHHWPAFNVADAAITVGTVLLAAGFLFSRPPAAPRSR